MLKKEKKRNLGFILTDELLVTDESEEEKRNNLEIKRNRNNSRNLGKIFAF